MFVRGRKGGACQAPQAPQSTNNLKIQLIENPDLKTKNNNSSWRTSISAV